MIPPRFVLPVLLAAAIHAALFAVFPSAPSPRSDSDKRVVRISWPPIDPLIEPPAVVAAPADAGGAAGERVASIPESPRVPQPSDSGFERPRFESTEGPAPEKIPVHPTPGTPGNPLLPGPGIAPVDSRLLDREPRARARVAPEYPFEAKRRGLEGGVEVAFVVGPDGGVQDARVIRSDHRELEAAALRAVLKWRFEPGRYRGRAVSFRMSVPIVFRIADD